MSQQGWELIREITSAVRTERLHAEEPSAVRAVVVRPDVAMEIYSCLYPHASAGPRKPPGGTIGRLDGVEVRCVRIPWTDPNGPRPPRYTVLTRGHSLAKGYE